MAAEKVIVVDDDPGTLNSLRAILRIHGLSSEGYTSPIDFFASIQPDDIGCVLTDLRMPGMDGLQLQRRLQDMSSCLSLILVTGYADVPVAVEVMSRGAVTVMEKPVEPYRLAYHVRQAIEASRQRQTQFQKSRDALLRLATISHEELQVMRLAIRGMPNKTISEALRMSPRTTDRRRQSALAKAQVSSVSEFAVILETAGLLHVERAARQAAVREPPAT
jgi:two-component system, LuxR family, response regulator FixJ